MHSIFWHDTEVAGRKLGVTLQPLELRGREDFEVAFAAAKQGNAQALLAFARRIAALIGPATKRTKSQAARGNSRRAFVWLGKTSEICSARFRFASAVRTSVAVPLT